MRRTLVAMAAALAALAPAASAQTNSTSAPDQPSPGIPPPPPGIRWLSGPTGDMLRLAYPEAAMHAHVAGEVTLVCTINAEGGFSDCSVASETPPHWDFGRGALSLAPKLKVKTEYKGKSYVGYRTPIFIHFALPP